MQGVTVTGEAPTLSGGGREETYIITSYMCVLKPMLTVRSHLNRICVDQGHRKEKEGGGGGCIID
ncbi:hypothetical protein JZ751_024421 [Albula glossodonta]|uniref:Uncharacterized protein n=1 Tax=Albula glossodonta TaxID=121402 RepID=A0A8T2NN76_9TELE|nr:hypothetical protein JZ751_024421 [Albula glossodonta]